MASLRSCQTHVNQFSAKVVKEEESFQGGRRRCEFPAGAEVEPDWQAGNKWSDFRSHEPMRSWAKQFRTDCQNSFFLFAKDGHSVGHSNSNGNELGKHEKQTKCPDGSDRLLAWCCIDWQSNIPVEVLSKWFTSIKLVVISPRGFLQLLYMQSKDQSFAILLLCLVFGFFFFFQIICNCQPAQQQKPWWEKSHTFWGSSCKWLLMIWLLVLQKLRKTSFQQCCSMFIYP